MCYIGGFVLENIILLSRGEELDNAVADSISRLPRLESLVGDDIGPKSSASTSTSTLSIELDDELILTFFVNHPVLADKIVI